MTPVVAVVVVVIVIIIDVFIPVDVIVDVILILLKKRLSILDCHEPLVNRKTNIVDGVSHILNHQIQENFGV